VPGRAIYQYVGRRLRMLPRKTPTGITFSSSVTQNKNKSGGGAGSRVVKPLGTVGSKRGNLFSTWRLHDA